MGQAFSCSKHADGDAPATRGATHRGRRHTAGKEQSLAVTVADGSPRAPAHVGDAAREKGSTSPHDRLTTYQLVAMHGAANSEGVGGPCGTTPLASPPFVPEAPPELLTGTAPSRRAEDYTATGLVGGVFYRPPGTIQEQRISIDGCQSSRFLLLDLCDSVEVDNCDGCFFVIGPTFGSVFFRNVRNCVAVVACGQLRCRDVHGLAVSLLCRGMPALESSSNIRIACWSGLFAYPGIEEHLARAKLSVFTNMYSTVHDFTPSNQSSGGRATAPSGRDVGDRDCFGRPYAAHAPAAYVDPSQDGAVLKRGLRNQLGQVAHRAPPTRANYRIVSPSVLEEACLCAPPPRLGGLDSPDSLGQVGEEGGCEDEGQQSAVALEDVHIGSTGGEGPSPVAALAPAVACFPIAPALLDAEEVTAPLFRAWSARALFHTHVVIPYTHGQQTLAPLERPGCRLRLFVATASGGGMAIARRLVRDVELLRRRTCLSQLDTAGTLPPQIPAAGYPQGDPACSVLLLNAAELHCSKSVVEAHVTPALQQLGESSADIREHLCDVPRRLEGRVCVFLLILLTSAAASGKQQPTEGIEALFQPRAPSSAIANGAPITMGDQVAPHTASVEASAWATAVLVNCTVSMEHVRLLQHSLFHSALMDGSGFGSAL